MHEHRFQGQTLKHSHPSDHDHGYFEHPEDGFPYLSAPSLEAIMARLAAGENIADIANDLSKEREA